MSHADASRWDSRHRRIDPACVVPRPPEALAGQPSRLPRRGAALEAACGTGAVALWLASRGLHVTGLDVSPVAVRTATTASRRAGLANRAAFRVHDLETGLAGLATESMDVVVCERFRDPDLSPELLRVLRRDGLLAVSVLSEVGAAPGRFRASAGDLDRELGAHLDVVRSVERDGLATLAGFRRRRIRPG